jgi:hypothetical protein
MRVTFQPIVSTPPTAEDVALHAVYTIPAAELAGVIAQLRTLGASQGLTSASPLIVNPSLANTMSQYAASFTSLVATYAQPAQLIRVTAIDQPAQLAPSQWYASGVELTNGTFQVFQIPTIPARWCSTRSTRSFRRNRTSGTARYAEDPSSRQMARPGSSAGSSMSARPVFSAIDA